MWYIVFSCIAFAPPCLLTEDLAIRTAAVTGAECKMMGELTLILLEREGKAGGVLRYRCELRDAEG